MTVPARGRGRHRNLPCQSIGKLVVLSATQCNSVQLGMWLIYAARCGCHVRVGILQSMPSSSMDNCAGVNDTAPLSA